MPFDFVADTDNMILAGAEEVFTGTSGTPTGSEFLYGTGFLSNSVYGIITSCTLKTIGEKTKIKGGAGVTIADAIIDPGWSATVSILFPKSVGRPKHGAYMVINIPHQTGGSADVATTFVIMDFSIKWEREGWRMLDMELEHRKALMTSGSDLFSFYIDSDATLGDQIDSQL